jgi:pimeloyl-ACP methyl ester carboxylesterase
LSLWRQPGALTAALNYYRASNAHRRALDDPSFEFGPVYTPTLFLWGRNDAYIRRQAVDLAAGYMRGPYRVVELDAEHLLVQEAPAIVEAEVLSHLKAHPL